MTNPRYLLPGESDNVSPIVHTHGVHRNSSSKQQYQKNFLSTPRIYVPKERDFVIGIVIVRTPDLFLVDINSCESAILPLTSFDSGQIPSRAAMNRLSVVYAHVVRTDSWTQTELSCQSIDRAKKKHDFGLVEQGHILRCSLGLAEKLQNSPLINRLSQTVDALFIRVTRNGFIWYKTDTTNSMIAIKNVLYKHEYENNIDELINLYHQLMNQLRQQDDNCIQAKQNQKIVKKEIPKKNPEPSNNNNAMTRLLNDVIKSVLDKIIDDIEKNEK